ncbi:hypothetical protein ROZALSC1DRAFT_31363 [Rozella allomycis CSF55]|uniref:RING-type domain-containing protein n=1 Tax=Rozella allomycis (strain CSF55) TaxID=988480 RepID=A0A075B031_ROZAC|nr:hypothetical protein O9G_003733 [Rozella allomycis CSF55]RKP16775.1 hypothetical protein ROZALSC1DRAFT_31363 [Rozella allomycis CSF55]|eukprot:EPZ34134.1 hypothetical protein O9G_003733 [Rozella allomycis CSF55]
MASFGEFSSSLSGFLIPVSYLGSSEKGCSQIEYPFYGLKPVKTESFSAFPWIALVERGKCSFVDKARAMQASGASGMIVGDNEDSGLGLITMYSGSDAKDVTIYPTFVSRHSYNTLLEQSLKNFHEFEIIDESDAVKNPSDWAENAISWNRHLLPSLPIVIISEEYNIQWPLVDIIVIGACLPILVGVFIYALWKIRRRRQRLQSENRPKISQEKVKSLPIVPYSGPLEEACPICLDDFKKDMDLKQLPCRHLFHVECIDSWLLNHKNFCPMCKLPVFNDEAKGDPAADEEAGLLQNEIVQYNTFDDNQANGNNQERHE